MIYMEKEEAIRRVYGYLEAQSSRESVVELEAEPFEAGWIVFHPSPPVADASDIQIGKAIFLVAHDGDLEVTSSSIPPGVAEADFIRRHSGTS